MGFLRHPRTTQELRHWYGTEADRAEEPETPRIRCRRHRLRTAWDDIWVESQRSWKAYRKTQWREKRTKPKKPVKFHVHPYPKAQVWFGKKQWYFNKEVGRVCYRCTVTRIAARTGHKEKRVWDSMIYYLPMEEKVKYLDLIRFTRYYWYF